MTQEFTFLYELLLSLANSDEEPRFLVGEVKPIERGGERRYSRVYILVGLFLYAKRYVIVSRSYIPREEELGREPVLNLREHIPIII